MTLYRAFDAAFPPSAPYPGAVGVMGYIGGNTPHIWTPAEWRRFSMLTQWPIWVGANEGDPIGHGAQAVAAARALGWSPDPASGRRRAIVLDFETEIDPAWVDAWSHQVWTGGFETFVYGSASTVTGDPPKEGRWVALYDGRQDLTGIPAAVAHQYLPNVPWDGTQVDLSVVDAAMMAHGAVGPRI